MLKLSEYGEFINTIRAREKMRESERKKEIVQNRTQKRISLHDMRGWETSRKFEQKRSFVTRYTQE